MLDEAPEGPQQVAESLVDHHAAHQRRRRRAAAIGLHHLAVLRGVEAGLHRSEEHTSELQSLMRISYAVICLKKKNIATAHYSTHLTKQQHIYHHTHKQKI